MKRTMVDELQLQTQSPPRNHLKAQDILRVLRERVAILSGGRDRNSRPIITFPSRDAADVTSSDDLRMLLLYLHAIPA